MIHISLISNDGVTMGIVDTNTGYRLSSDGKLAKINLGHPSETVIEHCPPELTVKMQKLLDAAADLAAAMGDL